MKLLQHKQTVEADWREILVVLQITLVTPPKR
jgi:hypothetical protein